MSAGFFETSSGSDGASADGSYLPQHNAEYKLKEYWDRRFTVERTYDWFKSYESFRIQLLPELKPSDRILIVGCGNSTLSELLYKDGFENITNIDFSQIVIDNMRERCNPECPRMKWVVMDMLAMTFENAEFDVVIEKGTIDALLVDQRDPWRPSRQLWKQMQQLLFHVHRVLTDCGKFVSITFAQPHFRRPLIHRKRFGWDFNYLTFGDDFHYYIYVMNKVAVPVPPRRRAHQPPSTAASGDQTNDPKAQRRFKKASEAAKGLTVAATTLIHASGVPLKHIEADAAFSDESDGEAERSRPRVSPSDDKDAVSDSSEYEDLKSVSESENEDFLIGIDVEQ
ncbi:endothelin converting enzyme 2 [Capsaspora owczarzaki ATCC 30864]|uniref:EEF1A lysine methyltransferase 4 n=1 Tax=Capsaspora owczarzaki (strain ATCC 30864) TaxID=595528 RepID=A0A0D2WNR4_CAPO3|nr:endothelin converting enzyme 2 [Capsaspora owczarzaki ATCC 30864]KJE92855.1 endothelin converting enzyme 2 [Capsaspora owczarzaki ATCC 30864]|eukprot:XP_004363474.2 endothelin converting enzyme 2 [Capsaspora owczarzaki ATCC 30864]